MTESLPYEDALKWVKAESKNDPSVLLGNGFSMAYDTEAFSYSALKTHALSESGIDEIAEDLFDRLGTNDFESVIKRLTATVDVLKAAGGEDVENLVSRLGSAAESLKDILAQALAALHPDVVYDVDADSYRNAVEFLKPFGTIYSTNYDMLLYWTVMQSMEDASRGDVRRDDGFREARPSDAYVVWDPFNVDGQNVHYLHGALHLYLDESRGELQKLTWRRTSRTLLDQIRSQLASERYPLMVSEGSSEEKRAKILQSAYLGRSLRSLSSRGGGMVAFGLAFSENDAHIVDAIAESKIARLAVGVFGDWGSDSNLDLRRNVASAVARRRARIEKGSSRTALNVEYFDSSSVRVW